MAELFTESKHCHNRRDGVDGASCAACRGSLHFRRSLLNAFRLPGDNINFECPHGKGPVTDVQLAKPTPTKEKGLISRAVEAAGSIAKTHIARLDRVDEDELKRRLEICDKCPHVIRNKNGEPKRCGACGCVLKAKAIDQKQLCPKGKW